MEKRIDNVELNRIKKSYGNDLYCSLKSLPLLSLSGDAAIDFFNYASETASDVNTFPEDEDDLIIQDMVYRIQLKDDTQNNISYMRVNRINNTKVELGIAMPPAIATIHLKKQRIFWVEAVVEINPKGTIVDLNKDKFIDEIMEYNEYLDRFFDRQQSVNNIATFIMMALSTCSLIEQFTVTKGYYPVKITRRVDASTADVVSKLCGPTIELHKTLPCEKSESKSKSSRQVVQHKRRAHSRKCTHERYKNHPRFGKHIRVKGSWVGSKKAYIGDYKYEVLI